MKRQGVKLIVVEPYFDSEDTGGDRRASTGGKVLVLAPSVGGRQGGHRLH